MQDIVSAKKPHDRYSVLFEPMAIGPVTAPNRFYQVPHCTGMGQARPNTLAAMRGIKAEGGWGVVCTEYCSIHPSSDDVPYPYASLWDRDDMRAMAQMTDAVHAHGSLAGCELWHGGSYVGNIQSRLPSIAPTSMPCRSDPVQSAPMDRSDIAQLRRWHRDAAVRAREAGFDIVYVYATHGYLLSEFLSRSLNQRSDDYGGSLENRLRLVRELLEETREAVGDKCAVAARFSATGAGPEHFSAEEAHDALASLGGLADLWDLVVDDYGEEMGSSRFITAGSLAERVAYARKLTNKPTVTVGRYTSPDEMAGVIRQGLVDFIGAARPSIADPFLPAKIAEGRLEDIRECIGCNICYAHNTRGASIRCTQNPTMGEEWRNGWHPEQVPPGRDESVLIVGAGPAGLEAAHILAKRGYQVTLADAEREAGGRVTRESRLPGLAEWGRVRDYRLGQILGRSNVALHLESTMSAADVLAFGAHHVLIATGARWRDNLLGRWHQAPVPGLAKAAIRTPDQIMLGDYPGPAGSGSVIVFDDDHYYMGPCIALALAGMGARVNYVTTQGRAGHWSSHTEEQMRTQAAMIKAGIAITTNRAVSAFDGAGATLTCIFTDQTEVIEAAYLVPVTSREPSTQLWQELSKPVGGIDPNQAPVTLTRIGDCHAPGIIAAAVYSGHKAARELGSVPAAALREITGLVGNARGVTVSN